MFIILDIGGTHTRIGIVNEDFRLLETSLLITPKNYEDGLSSVISHVRSRDVRISGVCIGIAGVADNGKLYSSPNLKDWVGKPIESDFEKEFNVKPLIENDAALAGLGEAVYGAGKDNKIVSYLTISTGVGGVRIVNNKIDERIYGFEPGCHIISLSPSLRPDSQQGRKSQNNTAIEQCNNLSSFESLVSGKSIKKRYGEAPENIEDGKVWGETMKTIAIGIANSCFFWSPEIIVLGGGVTHSDFFNLSSLKKEVKKLLKKTYPNVPEIKKSILGDFSGIWGGIAYLRNTL